MSLWLYPLSVVQLVPPAVSAIRFAVIVVAILFAVVLVILVLALLVVAVAVIVAELAARAARDGCRLVLANVSDLHCLLLVCVLWLGGFPLTILVRGSFARVVFGCFAAFCCGSLLS